MLGASQPISGVEIRLTQVISALSYALDITEGQPEGHAVRTCLIGMRLAQEIGLDTPASSALYYALLLKDLGCSSNAARVCGLFGADDQMAKGELKTTDWSSVWASIGYICRTVAPGAPLQRRLGRFFAVAKGGRTVAREMVALRCDRGGKIARDLQLPIATSDAIRSLDEHWDGSGYPLGLRGEQIPLLGRILSLAQTVEVFWRTYGLESCCDMAKARRKTWFDPKLVAAFLSLRKDVAFWEELAGSDVAAKAAAAEPQEQTLQADDAALDRIALGFAQVIDAKSPWTYRHSSGVAEIATGIGDVLGFSPLTLKNIRRAGLLHDIGKLGVSNLILDKPGKLTPEELTQMRRHSDYTHRILRRVDGFKHFAELAASHHERLDGRGYHRGLSAADLSPEMRTLVVADMYEALAAKRPYRQDLSAEDVMKILARETGAGLCPEVVAALKVFIARSNYTPMKEAA